MAPQNHAIKLQLGLSFIPSQLSQVYQVELTAKRTTLQLLQLLGKFVAFFRIIRSAQCRRMRTYTTYAVVYKQKNRAVWTTRLARCHSPITHILVLPSIRRELQTKKHACSFLPSDTTRRLKAHHGTVSIHTHTEMTAPQCRHSQVDSHHTNILPIIESYLCLYEFVWFCPGSVNPP